MAVIYIYYL